MSSQCVDFNKKACVLYSLSDDNCNSSSGIVPVNMLSFSVRVSVASQCEFNIRASHGKMQAKMPAHQVVTANLIGMESFLQSCCHSALVQLQDKRASESVG